LQTSATTIPLLADVNFGIFVNETGGKLFYNRNDIDKEINRSLQVGAEYYTLTYQPRNLDQNGKGRRIRVSLRDPHLRAITKAGYFGPDENAPINPQQQKMFKLAEAVQSTIRLTALHVSPSNLVRHPDSRNGGGYSGIEVEEHYLTADRRWQRQRKVHPGSGKS